MKPSFKFFIFVMLGVMAGSALAQQKTQGEMWRTTVSMQMTGFSMPSQTMEFCAPVSDEGPIDAMLRQQNNDNCQITNLKRSGNKVSADLKCGGRDAMEGHLEMEMLGDTMRGTMTMKSSDVDMTMKYEGTKLGKACEVQSADDIKRKVEAQMPKMPEMPTFDMCQIYYDNVKGDSLDEQAAMFLSQPGGQDCTKHASFKNFCAAAQTPDGFMSLDTADRSSRSQSGQDVLPASLSACGLGSNNAAIVALQDRLLTQAEKENRWGFLLRYGADKHYPRMVELAKKECAGRGFTTANPANGNLCRDYGWALSRNDRRGVLEAAGCRAEITERGVCIGYGTVARTTGSAAGRSEEAKPKEAAEPASKIRQGVRGLLGR